MESYKYLRKIYENTGNTKIRFHANGILAAYLNFAYDLFVIDHNDYLRSRFVERLKNPREFQGTKCELFVAATFIRAGFKLEEIKRNGPEFGATYPDTERTYSVEAKSRHRYGVLGFGGGKRGDTVGIENLIRSAIAKNTNNPFDNIC